MTRFHLGGTVLQCLAVAGLLAGLHGIAFASDAQCQLPVSWNEGTSTWRIDGNCPDVTCDNPVEECKLVQLVVSVPTTIGCNCGASGADCTMAYTGDVAYDYQGNPHGQGGDAWCYANDCEGGCPAPVAGGPSVNGWRAATCPACGA